MSIGILIADDQALVRAGFRMIIEAQDDLRVVAEARDGGEAVEAARRSRPDIVLMDIRMPTIDGLEATRRIMAAADEPPRVLMLTTFDLDEYVFDALHAGASGFLLKDVPPEHLVAGIRIVAEGDSLLSPSVTRRLIESFVREAPTRPDRRELEELTATRTRDPRAWSRAASPTPRSPISSSSPARRSRHTSPGCSRSSTPRPRPGRRACLRDRHRPARSPALIGPHRRVQLVAQELSQLGELGGELIDAPLLVG